MVSPSEGRDARRNRGIAVAENDPRLMCGLCVNAHLLHGVVRKGPRAQWRRSTDHPHLRSGRAPLPAQLRRTADHRVGHPPRTIPISC